ncbi:MAG: hypothetical protein J6C67_02680 [Muribaculaceae bacterium]|nr:hypothetical protein [Muribaculaceae bacterium]
MNNRIKHGDKVKVDVYDEAGKLMGEKTGDDFYNLTDAIETAYTAVLPTAGDIRDYVFTVYNLTDGTSGRYRLNADEHVKLLE